MLKERAPIFSDERYKTEIEQRNMKMEMKKREREMELQEKELLEAEELARHQIH